MQSRFERIIKQQTPLLLGCLLFFSFLFTFSPKAFAASNFEIKPETVSTSIGELETIQIWLNSDQKILASDFEAYFSTELLEVVEISKGNIFDDYPALKYDNSTGIIAISGISTNSSKSFTGSGLFATVTLKSKKDGNAQLTLNYTPGSTIDSNIIPVANTVEEIRDDLTEGTSMLFQIGNFEDKPVIVASPFPSASPLSNMDIEDEEDFYEQPAIGGGIINSVTRLFRNIFGTTTTQNDSSQTTENSNLNSGTTVSDSETNNPSASNEPRNFRISTQQNNDNDGTNLPTPSAEAASQNKKSSKLLYLITLIVLIASAIGAVLFAKKKNLFKKNHKNHPPTPPIVKL